MVVMPDILTSFAVLHALHIHPLSFVLQNQAYNHYQYTGNNGSYYGYSDIICGVVGVAFVLTVTAIPAFGGKEVANVGIVQSLKSFAGTSRSATLESYLKTKLILISN